MITALTDLLAEKKHPEALQLLNATPEPDLRAAGLIKLWDACHAVNFTPGELVLAPLIERGYDGRPAEVLRAVTSYTRAGMMTQAAETLRAVLTFPGANKQIRQMIDLVARIKNQDLCYAFLQFLLADPDVTVRERVVNGGLFASAVDKAGMRHIAVRAMWLCLEGAGDEVEALERIARTLEFLGERSMALSARMRVAQALPDDVTKELEVGKLLAVIDRPKARTALEELLKRPAPTAAFWTGVSVIQQQLNQVKDAIDSMNMALKYGGVVNDIERRLAALHMLLPDTRTTMSLIKRIIVRPGLTPSELRHLSFMAMKCKEIALALSLAKRQYEMDGDFGTLLFYATTLSDAGRSEEAGNLLSGFCDSLADIKPLTRGDLLKVCEVAAKISRDDLQLRIIDMGLVWFPGDVGLSDLRKQVAARVRFLGGGLFAVKG